MQKFSISSRQDDDDSTDGKFMEVRQCILDSIEMKKYSRFNSVGITWITVGGNNVTSSNGSFMLNLLKASMIGFGAGNCDKMFSCRK